VTPPSSCPRLSRASTPCFDGIERGVDGRHKAGHDEGWFSHTLAFSRSLRTRSLGAGAAQESLEDKGRAYGRSEPPRRTARALKVLCSRSRLGLKPGPPARDGLRPYGSHNPGRCVPRRRLTRPPVRPLCRMMLQASPPGSGGASTSARPSPSLTPRLRCRPHGARPRSASRVSRGLPSCRRPAMTPHERALPGTVWCDHTPIRQPCQALIPHDTTLFSSR
jgi:hypothetical protein